MATLEIHPDYRPLLEATSLDTFDALFAAGQRGRVDGHRERSVSRLELAGPGGQAMVVYIKRQRGDAARPAWKDLLEFRWPRLPAEREWRNAQKLLAAGVAVAPPVAWGRSTGPAEPRSLIVFREVKGPSLAAWLHAMDEGGAAPPPRIRRAVAEAIGKAVLRLHGSGLSFPDLYAKHIFLENLESGRPRAVLIDVSRLRRLARDRWLEDFGALLATARSPVVHRTDRLRVLKAYFGEAFRLCSDVVPHWVRAIERHAERMKGRGQDPNLIPSRRTAPPGMVPPADEQMVEADGGRLRINEAFRAVLESAGLTTLDAIMAFQGGRAYRRVAGRSTVRVELADPRGGTRALYIKRYTRVPPMERLRRTLSMNPPVSLAYREFGSLRRVMDAGIAAMRWAAVGEAFARGGRAERSCFITEEVGGATPADVYGERTFAGHRSPAATAAKRRLVRQIARLARKFHDARLTHRDFYLCHILVRPMEGAEPVLHLIDLQRVVHHKRGVRSRWIVKDLAALWFSSQPSPATSLRSAVFTRTDAVRFAREYFGVARLTDAHQAFLRRVARKARVIARHDARHRRRRGGAP